MTGGSTNTVSQQTVPSWLQPYLTGALSQGQTLLSSGGPQYYPGQTVAPLSGLQTQGIQSAAATAAAPNAAQAASNQNINIESGQYLNPATNPYLTGTFNQASDAVNNQIASEFAGSGRNIIGSVPVQESADNNLANQIYGGAYQTGMQQMVQAQALSPSLTQGTYLPSQELLSAGGTQQQEQQNQDIAAQNAYNYTQQLPENMLSWYSGLLNQNASPFQGATGSSTANNNSLLTDVGAGVGSIGLLGGLLGAASDLGDLFSLSALA